MSSTSLGSRVRVTAFLALSGGAVGALTATALSFLGTVVANATLPSGHVEYHYGPIGFALAGAIGTPFISWLFMRRVPLWRAIAEPAIGGILGTLLALAAIPFLPLPLLAQPLLVIAGIGGAALRLRATHLAAKIPVHAT
jgi:hypothetical protein